MSDALATDDAAAALAYGTDLYGRPLNAPEPMPTLAEREAIGMLDVIRDEPADIAAHVAASVMRKLARIELRQVGTVVGELRDAIEVELRSALRLATREKSNERGTNRMALTRTTGRRPP